MANIRKWFMGVRGRLLVLIALPFVILLAAVGTSLYSFSILRGNLENIVSVRMPRLMLLMNTGKKVHAVNQYILQDFLEKKHLTNRSQSVDEIQAMIEEIGKNLEDMKKYPSSEKFNAIFDPIFPLMKSAQPILAEVVQRLKSDDTSADNQTLQLISEKMTPSSEKIIQVIKNSEKLVVENTENILKQTKETSNSLTMAIVLISLIGGLFSITLGVVFSTRMVRGLTGLALTLSEGADKVTTTSVQMNTSSEALSASVTEQAAALQQTAASIEQMSAMVTKNTENSSKSREISTQSHQSATQGKQVVDEMIQAIEDINVSNTQIMQEVENSNREISEIIKVIGEIGNKTKVINDIVFQTKLLSFNASVEAARAGEHGKGFAVVAEEVGNLAQMSGNAAREISTMLEGSISKVESIVNNTKTKVERLIVNGKEKVHNGSEIAKRCGEVLDVIVNNVSTVNHMVEEISSASQEQDHGIKEITRAISQLDQVTQQNSVSCQESASAASSLSSEAQILRDTIQHLHVVVEGESSVRAESHHSDNHSSKPKSGGSAGSNSKSKPAPTKAREKKAHAEDISRKVIPITKGSKTAAAGPAGKERVSKPFKAAAASVASGTAISVPSENDPRFEDV